VCLFHTAGPKQAASTSVPKSFTGLHRFCPSVVQSFLCLQLFLKRKTKIEIVSITITFGHAELTAQSWLISAYSLKVSTSHPLS